MTAVACLSACANLPYIEPTRHAPEAGANGSNGSLEDAVDYADRSYDAYEGKIFEEWRRQQGLAATLIGAGAIAIGASVGHAHRDVFTTLGLGSATLYQLGTWNTNAGRTGIYLEGMKTLVCAKAAVQPLRMSKDARSRIREAQRALVLAIKNASGAVALAGAARTNGGEDEVAKALQTELQSLQDDLDAALQLLARSASIDQRMDGAGAMLQQKIDDIRTVIDTALQATTPADLSGLRASIQGISTYATQFNGDVQSAGLAVAKSLLPASTDSSTTTANAQAKQADDAEALSPPPANVTAGQALGAVSAARFVLRGASAQLRGTVDRPADTVSIDLKTCGVDATKLSLPLSLESTSLALKQGQVHTGMFEAKGGTAPLQVVYLDSPAPGLTVSMSPEGRTVVVVADTTTQEGAYRFKVRDATSAGVTLTVTVNAAAAPQAATAAQQSGGQFCSELGQVSKAKACFIQQELQITVDGTAGKQTCSAFQRALAGKTVTQGVDILARRSGISAIASDDSFMKKLNGQSLPNCNAGGAAKVVTKDTASAAPDSSAEAKLTAAQVRDLAAALGHPPVTDIGQLREALVQNQHDSNCASTKGVFTQAEIDRLGKHAKCS
ncbi:MAG TPA: hypothetical protein VGM81_09965 [Burkholderiaceae bacterium]